MISYGKKCNIFSREDLKPVHLSLPQTTGKRWLSPSISGPQAGQAVHHHERLITFLPPAVYTSVLAATPIHYPPWSRAAHISPLSASASFTPSRGGAWLLSKTRRLLISRRTGGRASRLNTTAGIPCFSGGVFLVGTCVWIWDWWRRDLRHKFKCADTLSHWQHLRCLWVGQDQKFSRLHCVYDRRCPLSWCSHLYCLLFPP